MVARLPCDRRASHISPAWNCTHGGSQMPWHVQGRLPFRAKDQAGLFKAIVKGVYDPLPDNFSAPLKHIMKGMLMINPVSSSSHTCPYHTLARIPPLSLLYRLALITLWLSPHSCSYHTLALISPLSLLLRSCPYCTLALISLWFLSHLCSYLPPFTFVTVLPLLHSGSHLTLARIMLRWAGSLSDCKL